MQGLKDTDTSKQSYACHQLLACTPWSLHHARPTMLLFAAFGPSLAMCRNLSEAEDQGFNKGEVEGLKDMGNQHLLRLSESTGDALPPHSLEAMLEQQPEGGERGEGHRVYLPGQGWTTISGTHQGCVKGIVEGWCAGLSPLDWCPLGTGAGLPGLLRPVGCTA